MPTPHPDPPGAPGPPTAHSPLPEPLAALVRQVARHAAQRAHREADRPDRAS